MSAPYQVYVVACRACVEKVVGGFVAAYGDDLMAMVDGTFFLSEPPAWALAEDLNKRDGIAAWNVYPALLTIQALEE